MRQVILGSVVAGLAMWVVGFIFWGPLLGWIPLSVVPDGNAAAVQEALRANLGPSGTGSYAIPSPMTNAGSVMHANGPVALVHFANRGFPAVDSMALMWGLVLAMLCALAMGLALRSVAGGLSYGGRLKLVALAAVAIAGYTDLGQPVFNHAPWGYFIHMFVSDVASWMAAGVIFARWFLPPPEPEI